MKRVFVKWQDLFKCEHLGEMTLGECSDRFTDANLGERGKKPSGNPCERCRVGQGNRRQLAESAE